MPPVSALCHLQSESGTRPLPHPLPNLIQTAFSQSPWRPSLLFSSCPQFRPETGSVLKPEYFCPVSLYPSAPFPLHFPDGLFHTRFSQPFLFLLHFLSSCLSAPFCGQKSIPVFVYLHYISVFFGISLIFPHNRV